MKIIIMAIACLVLAGCGRAGSVPAGIEKEVFPVVEKYLENAAAGNWEKAFETLSGEALAEAEANSPRVKAEEKIVAKTLRASPVCRDIALVEADLTKISGEESDRRAYLFRLKKEGGRWLIYNTSSGEYIHGGLKPGKLPPEAAETVRTYLELPYSEKRNGGQKFLAGRLLDDHRKAGALPVNPKTVSIQERIATRVINLECLGVSGDYAVVLAECETSADGRVQRVEAVIDLLSAGGKWKICRMNVTKA